MLNNGDVSMPSPSEPDPSRAEAQLDEMRQRELEIMQLLGTSSPDRIMHDLRNVLNELELLRALAEDKM